MSSIISALPSKHSTGEVKVRRVTRNSLYVSIQAESIAVDFYVHRAETMGTERSDYKLTSLKFAYMTYEDDPRSLNGYLRYFKRDGSPKPIEPQAAASGREGDLAYVFAELDLGNLRIQMSPDDAAVVAKYILGLFWQDVSR